MPQRPITTILVAMALACLVSGCGDGVLIVSFTSGIIAGDPTCQGSSGQFDLLDQSGLTVLVVINSDTVIFVNSGQGHCNDLHPNAPVTVQGPRQGSHITAQSVQIG